MKVAKFTSSRGIDIESDFVWWVPYTLRKKDSIIAALISRTKRISHKYGVKLPSIVQEKYDIDKANDNTLWRDALNKEMENLKVDFSILLDGKYLPVHYAKASGYFIFDVRVALELKEKWVKYDYKTSQLEWSTFAGVV